MASQGTILSAKRKNGANSFDRHGTLDLVKKTFDGSYFSKDSIWEKKKIELFKTFIKFL